MTRRHNFSGPFPFQDLGKKLRRDMGRALGDFSMITPGDRILIGLSGGKDSLFLLVALGELQRRSPVPFSLEACTVDPLEKRWDTSYLEDLCASLGIPWHHQKHDIFGIIQNREERSPCSFCANMRRGILNSIAQKKGCNLLALGHHQDDAIETVFLNLFSGGRFRCFSPKLYQSNSQITLIRPLVYIREERISQETRRLGLLPVPFECPHAERSHREKAKNLVKGLEKEIPSLRTNIIHALLHGEPGDIWSSFLEKSTGKSPSRRNEATGEARKR